MPSFPVLIPLLLALCAAGRWLRSLDYAVGMGMTLALGTLVPVLATFWLGPLLGGQQVFSPTAVALFYAADRMFNMAVDFASRHPGRFSAETLKKLLAQARPHVRYFHSSKYVGDLASGEVCVSIGWSGAIQQARSRGAQAETPVQVDYVIPKEGAMIWFDMMAIPADAPHPENAYAFLDYLMEPKFIADISNTVGQANGNAASLPYVAESIRNDPAIYPTEEVYGRLTIDRTWSPEITRDVNRAWTRIKTAQ